MSAQKRPSRKPSARDTDATPFSSILTELVERVPGAFAAAMVDGEGETVDYTGLVDPFEIRVAAAHLQIVLRQIDDFGALGKLQWLVVRGAKRSIVAHRLPEGYALAVLLRRRAGFTASRRAFASCERALAKEAGWPAAAGRAGRAGLAGLKWFAADVVVDPRGRPTRVLPDVEVVVLGAVMGLPARERGFRVRTSKGAELTLVREAKRCWYADEDPATLR